MTNECDQHPFIAENDGYFCCLGCGKEGYLKSKGFEPVSNDHKKKVLNRLTNKISFMENDNAVKKR